MTDALGDLVVGTGRVAADPEADDDAPVAVERHAAAKRDRAAADAGSVLGVEAARGAALSSDGRRLFTANGNSNPVSVIDARTEMVVATVPVGSESWGLAVVGEK